MHRDEFEKQLRKKDRYRRLIEGVLTGVLLAVGILFWYLRESTKEVILHEGFYFIPGWEEVNYNDNYVPFILLGFLGAFCIGVFWLIDLMMCRFATIQKDLHQITIYRGMLHEIVYVDGAEKGRIEPFSFTNVAEVRLANNVKVTVSFQRGIFHIAHVSFSDDTPSIEV